MVYDPQLVDRLRQINTQHFPHLVEKNMFGGFGYFINGNYAYGASKDFIVRVGLDRYESSLSQPHVRVMDITGRPMRGWVIVDSQGIETDEQLRTWMQNGVDFASQLPTK
jgi:hypothetical protein